MSLNQELSYIIILNFAEAYPRHLLVYTQIIKFITLSSAFTHLVVSLVGINKQTKANHICSCFILIGINKLYHYILLVMSSRQRSNQLLNFKKSLFFKVVIFVLTRHIKKKLKIFKLIDKICLIYLYKHMFNSPVNIYKVI